MIWTLKYNIIKCERRASQAVVTFAVSFIGYKTFPPKLQTKLHEPLKISLPYTLSMWLLSTNKKAQIKIRTGVFRQTSRDAFKDLLVADGYTHVSEQLSPQAVQECYSFLTPLAFLSLSSQTVSLSPTADISMDSPSNFFHTTSSEPVPLITKNPSFEAQPPEDSKQRVNKGFRVSEILGSTNSYRSSILEFFTNFAK